MAVLFDCDAIMSLGAYNVLVLHLNIALLGTLVMCIMIVTVSLVPWCKDSISSRRLTLCTLLLLQ